MLWAVINFIAAWYFWTVSKAAFEARENFSGWTCIFISALNFASAMSTITPPMT